MQTPTEEILDIVDENDNVIGQQPRSETYKNGANFRVINAFVINSEGKLWIPRRTATKRMFPNCLDMSVGGHVETGEEYELTFRRETMEELGIDIDNYKWEELGKMTPKEHGVSAFMKIYVIHADEVPNYNTNDFTGFEWLTADELLERIEGGDKVKGDLKQLVLYYKKMLDNK